MNKTCLIIINNMSGDYCAIREDKIAGYFGCGYDTTFFHITADNPFSKYVPSDRVVICGGDGTLNRIINIYLGKPSELIYCPFGTLNETSKRDVDKNGQFILKDGGEANGRYFSYVLATGTFTPLGYTVDNKSKQKLKAFAYIIKVFNELHVWRVNATINADGIEESGQYSLIMAIHSKQCFGLRFNKMFVPNDNKMFLLTIKAPRFNGLLGLAEMFFPFFRAFFIGFKRPYKSKIMGFLEVKALLVATDKEYDFCVDGERWVMPTMIDVKPIALNPSVKVVAQRQII